MSFKMAVGLNPKGSPDYTNEKGNHECVTFVKMVSKAPNTILWKRGIKVLDADPGSIAYGTAIATFNEQGHYPTDGSGQQHAAIYISHIKGESIKVYEQYNSIGMVKERTIHDLNTNKRSNNPDAYYVIE